MLMPELGQLWYSLFYLGIDTRIICPHGHDVLETSEDCPLLQTPARQGAGIAELVKLWTDNEKLPPHISGQCIECGASVNSGTRYKRISRLPELFQVAPNPLISTGKKSAYKKSGYKLAVPKENELMDFSDLLVEGNEVDNPNRRFSGLVAQRGSAYSGHYIAGLYAPDGNFHQCDDSEIERQKSLAQWWQTVGMRKQSPFQAYIYTFVRDDEESQEKPGESSGKEKDQNGGNHTGGHQSGDAGDSPKSGEHTGSSSGATQNSNQSITDQGSTIRWSGAVYCGKEKGLSFNNRETDLFSHRTFQDQELVQIPATIRRGKQRRFTVLSGMVVKKKATALSDEGKLINDTHSLYAHLLQGHRAGLFTERLLHRVMEALRDADDSNRENQKQLAVAQKLKQKNDEVITNQQKNIKGLQRKLAGPATGVSKLHPDQPKDREKEVEDLRTQLVGLQQGYENAQDELAQSIDDLKECQEHRAALAAENDTLRKELENRKPEDSTEPTGSGDDDMHPEAMMFIDMCQAVFLAYLKDRDRQTRPRSNASSSPNSGVSKSKKAKKPSPKQKKG